MRVPKYLNAFISLNTQLDRASFPSVSTHKKPRVHVFGLTRNQILVFLVVMIPLCWNIFSDTKYYFLMKTTAYQSTFFSTVISVINQQLWLYEPKWEVYNYLPFVSVVTPAFCVGRPGTHSRNSWTFCVLSLFRCSQVTTG